MSLKYEPASEPRHISVKQCFRKLELYWSVQGLVGANGTGYILGKELQFKTLLQGIYCTNSLILLVKKMLCSELYCQKGFNLIPFSYKISTVRAPGPRRGGGGVARHNQKQK